MFRSNCSFSRFNAGALLLAIGLLPSIQTVRAEVDSKIPVPSPVVNGAALRGLSTIGSAESMGEGRITFDVLGAWYHQETGYLNTPNAGANIFTGTGAFSYGVNSNVDVFTSVSGFSLSNNSSSNVNSGLGTICAGAQGSLPFPQSAYLRMGGQASIIGGTAHDQINPNRADGYNYFDTRIDYGFSGKLMQTFLTGSEDMGFKLHLNEGGVVGLDDRTPALLLLGAGLQGNIGPIVLGAELNSRTQFKDLSFDSDPLWFTPSIHFRTPYQMNAMLGVDVSLSADRDAGDPAALEPYRVFGAIAFSFDMLKEKRKNALLQKQKMAQEKADLEKKAATSNAQVKSLTKDAVADSFALANERANSLNQMDSMQYNAQEADRINKEKTDVLAKKATADSLALITAASDLAFEKEKRSDAEKQLLSTGELLLDAVYFETNKTDISINSKPYLNIIGVMLVKYPKLQIEVAGHTDNVGNKSSNITLSQGRAESVRNYLIQVSPALNSTLTARGYGMSMPKADNDTKEGRLTNRRVELRVINKDAIKEFYSTK